MITKLPKIIRAASDDSGDYRMWIQFEEDPKAVVDLAPIFERGSVFAPFRAHPKLFASVQVEPGGRAILWYVNGDVIDLGADTLWLMVHPEDRKALVGTA